MGRPRKSTGAKTAAKETRYQTHPPGRPTTRSRSHQGNGSSVQEVADPPRELDYPKELVTLSKSMLEDLLNKTAAQASKNTLNELRAAGVIKDTARPEHVMTEPAHDTVKNAKSGDNGGVKAFTESILEGEETFQLDVDES